MHVDGLFLVCLVVNDAWVLDAQLLRGLRQARQQAAMLAQGRGEVGVLC